MVVLLLQGLELQLPVPHVCLATAVAQKRKKRNCIAHDGLANALAVISVFEFQL